jgi:hypothetical protein
MPRTTRATDLADYVAAQRRASDLRMDLHHVANPAQRAHILRQLAIATFEMAQTFPRWGHRRDPEAAATYLDEAHLLELCAGLERDRAACGVRLRSDWTVVEHVAGPLLDQLADPDLTEHARADLYAQLHDTVAPLVAGYAAEILHTLERSHRQLAGPAIQHTHTRSDAVPARRPSIGQATAWLRTTVAALAGNR